MNIPGLVYDSQGAKWGNGTTNRNMFVMAIGGSHTVSSSLGKHHSECLIKFSQGPVTASDSTKTERIYQNLHQSFYTTNLQGAELDMMTKIIWFSLFER